MVTVVHLLSLAEEKLGPLFSDCKGFCIVSLFELLIEVEEHKLKRQSFWIQRKKDVGRKGTMAGQSFKRKTKAWEIGGTAKLKMRQ